MAQYQQTSATIQSLQNYITQLTVYINENNAKYTKNLQTLKHFYESQINNLNIKNADMQNQLLLSKNQLLTTKDLLNNRQKQIKDLRIRNEEYNEQNQQIRQKLNNERKKIDSLYEQIQSIKKDFKSDLDYQELKIKEIDNERSELILKLKERQQEINGLKKEVTKLEDQLSERYSLPQKLKDIQIESAKNRTLVATLTQSKKQLQTKIDYLNNELQHLRKQNQRLQVNYNNSKANTKAQLQQAINKQRQTAVQKQKRLQSTNQKQLFQINQLQNTLRSMKKENTQLQKKLNEFIEESHLLKNKIANHNHQKDKYIEEFQKLKQEYQDVIRNLEDTIPLYQKKNWDLQQENRDLNVQLDGLRDLLGEIKAMNSLQPLKEEYRKIAELQLLTQKDYAAHKANQKDNKLKQDSNGLFNLKEQPQFFRSENDYKWDQLLADIDNIQTA